MSDELLIEANRSWPNTPGKYRLGIRDNILVPPDELDQPETFSNHDQTGYTIVTPGWVNAHAHLELSAAPAIQYNGDFVDWIYQVLEFKLSQTKEQIREAYRRGAHSLHQSGVAHVLDHCDKTQWILDVAGELPIDVRPLKELIAFPPEHRTQKLEEARQFITRAEEQDLSWGLAPHAPYSAHPELYSQTRELIDRHGGTFSSHLHEIREELRFTEESTGRFQDLIRDRTGDRIDSPWRERPVAQLCRDGVYDSPGLAVHMNYLTDSDIEWVEGHNLYPVFCPRSYQYFRHETKPIQIYPEREIPFCLGTDSIASNEGLNMLEELETLAQWTDNIDPETILKALTVYPTRVMGEPERGVLSWGTPADLSIFEVPETDPVHELARGNARPIAVVNDGNLTRLEPFN